MNEIQENGNRRDFLKKFGVAVGFGVSLPVISNFLASCMQNPVGAVGQATSMNVSLKVSDFPALNNIGGWVEKHFTGKNNDYPVVIVRNSATTFLVLSTMCTHQACEVNAPNSSMQMQCPCHGSVFNATDGSNIKGPGFGTHVPALYAFANSYDSATGVLTIG